MNQTRVLILGGNGMLGHQLVGMLSRDFCVGATFRKEPTDEMRQHYPGAFRILEGVEATDFLSVERAIRHFEPDVLINAIGVVKQKKVNDEEFWDVNARFPKRLWRWCMVHGLRMIQISTDCVFSGTKGNYEESEEADTEEVYGLSKFSGEIIAQGALTLRTSLVGWQWNGTESLLSWLATHRNQDLNGYTDTFFSGITSCEMARVISMLISDFPNLSGLFHVAGERISKHDLLTRLVVKLGWNDIRVHPKEAGFCDRSLSAVRFQEATRWLPHSWDEMLDELAVEYPKYARFYHS